jgi:tripartite-type tricarboxylate transporter receptor subunit TctC
LQFSLTGVEIEQNAPRQPFEEGAMQLERRRFLALAAGAAAWPAAAGIARAENYPARPVRLLVGYAPAGPTDIAARLLSQWLSQRLGQEFIVENRPGAGSNLATEAVVHAAPDGYTLLLATTSNAINATLYTDLKFVFLRDLAPIASFMRTTSVMVVNPSFPAKTVPEFIAYAKAHPGKINLATAGIGSPPHIYGELFKARTGVDLAVVGYRGGGPALVDLLGGQVQVMFEGITSSLAYVKAGKLRALAVTAATRSPALPDVPTVGEFVPGYEASSYFGLAAPKSTPAAIIERLNAEVNAAVADGAMKARIADLGGTPFAGSPAEFAQLIAEETEKWRRVIRAANIRQD